VETTNNDKSAAQRVASAQRSASIWELRNRHSGPFPFTATSRFDALRLLKALSLSNGASPKVLAGFVIRHFLSLRGPNFPFSGFVFSRYKPLPLAPPRLPA
jgi:hypothetical protein